MFIEKARYLEKAQAIGGIVIDQHLSLKSANGALFSMTGDGNNDVNIPLVLMFKDQALQLFNLLSKQPKLIVYLGDENYLRNRKFNRTIQSNHRKMVLWTDEIL
jgi:mannosidase alpha-like ER degradation enhancer 3